MSAALRRKLCIGVRLAALQVAAVLAFAPAPAAVRASPIGNEIKSCEAKISGAPQSLAVDADACGTEINDLVRIGTRLGLPHLPLVSKPGANGFSLVFAVSQPPAHPSRFAVTTFSGDSPCQITLYPKTWRMFDQASGAIGQYGQFVLAHETVHCYQNVVIGRASENAWIEEGSAEYLAAAFVGFMPPEIADNVWEQWFNPDPPGGSLLTMSYNAIGWYALVATVKGSLWAHMVHAWRVGLSGGSTASIGALGGDAPSVVRDWGPSLVNDTAWGDPWVTHGPGLADVTGPVAATPLAGSLGGAVKPWTGEVRDETVDPGTLVIRVTGGYGSVHDVSGHAAVGFQTIVLCTDPRGCAAPTPAAGCPASPGKSSPRPPPSIDSTFLLALASGNGGASYKLTVYPSTKPVAPSGTPCAPSNRQGGGGGATVTIGSDPWVSDFDRQVFEFQGAGEYTFLRSAQDDLQVQLRMQPWPGSRYVSVVTAVAVRVGNATVEYDGLPDGQYAVYVNKTLTTRSTLSEQVGGGRLSVQTSDSLVDGLPAMMVTWPDGSNVVVADATGASGSTNTRAILNVTIHLVRARKRHVTGLVGNWGVRPADEFIGRQGQHFAQGTIAYRGSRWAPPVSDLKVLYHKFASSWRLTQRDSLFRYARGKTTTSYTIRAFPRLAETITVPPAPRRRVAIRDCQRAGITNSQVLRACVVDVVGTGKPRIASGDHELAASAGESAGTATATLASVDLGAGSAQPTIAYDHASRDTYIVWLPSSGGDTVDVCVVSASAPGCNGGAGPYALVDQLAQSGGATPIVSAAAPVTTPGGVVVVADLDGASSAANTAGYSGDGVVAWSSPPGGAAFASSDQGIADGGQELAPSVGYAPQDGAVALGAGPIAVYGNSYPFGSGFTDFELSSPAPPAMPTVDATGDYGSQIGVDGTQLAAIPDPAAAGQYLVVTVGAGSSVSPPGCPARTGDATGFAVAVGTPTALATQTAWSGSYFAPISCQAADPVLAAGGAPTASIGLLEAEGPGLSGSGSDGLYFRAFQPASGSFGPPVLVSDETNQTVTGPAEVSLSSDATGGMYASWADARGFVLSYSSGGGATWTPPVAVTLKAGASDTVVVGSAAGSGELAYTAGSQEYLALFSAAQLLGTN